MEDVNGISTNPHATHDTDQTEPVYEPPQIETTLTSDDLEREALYAGGTSQPDV